jgi:hypothetical protein
MVNLPSTYLTIKVGHRLKVPIRISYVVMSDLWACFYGFSSEMLAHVPFPAHRSCSTRKSHYPIYSTQ